MKILLTGANGQLGWELARSLLPVGDLIALDRGACDLSRPETLRETVDRIAPDVIVNAAAYTAVDLAEREETLAMAVNADAVGELAEAARRRNILLLHYSTDYVFDGRARVPYREDSATCPINAYGRSKLAGERAIAASGCEALTLRTSWVYATRGRNFVRTILRLAGEREELSVIDDQVGAPTWARNIADASALILAAALSERRAGSFRSEILHLCAAGETSWFGVARSVLASAQAHLPAGTLRLREVKAIPSSAYPLPAARPQSSRLDCSRLENRFGLKLPDWEHALRLCLEDLWEAGTKQ